jgi:PBSX family phage terminase large subunit
VEINIDLSSRYEKMPKNLEFILTDSFQAGLFGGFGNGKTESLCWRAILLALKYPEALGMLGRATYPELRDSTVRSFFEVCPPDLISQYNKQENVVYFINGAQMLFRAFDDPRKLLSMNLGWFGIDQLEEIEEEIYLQLLGRLRNPSVRFAFGVGNPEPNWVKKKFKDNAGNDKDLFFIEATTLENPYLPSGYVESLVKNYPDHWVKRYVYGDWSTFEGQVFTEFVESKHVVDPFDIPQAWKKEFVIDYGYRNPFACIKIAIDYDDNYYIIDEHYEREKIISYHAQKIKDMGYDKSYTCWIDPSCVAKNRTKNEIQVSVIDEFYDEEVYPIPANNNVAGVMRTNQWFKDGRLKIFKNCTNAIREIQNLRWKKVKPDWNKNMPEEMEDKDNHICDCIKYFANSRPLASKKPKPANWYMQEHKNQLMKVGKYKSKDWYND